MIEPVDGPGDPRLAEYAHVGDLDWLRAERLFVAEGRLVVRRLVEENRHDIRSIVVTPPALASLSDLLGRARCPVLVVAKDALASVTGFNFHRGCLALARRPDALPALGAFTRARLLIALEGVGNPDNVGGLFRVAAAFGAGGVLLDPASGDPFYRKAIRTSMGSVLRLPFTRVGSWPSDLLTLADAGFQIVALTPSADATPLASYTRGVAADARLLLMVGSEGPGLSAAAFEVATAKIRIPIAAGVDSLNVVVAAGIALAALSARSS